MDFPFQAERKGLGHAVLQGLEDKEEDVLILLGDTIFDVDFDEFRSREKNAIAVVKVDDPHRFGIAEVDDSNTVTRLVEKPDHPQSDLALAGMYYIKDQRILKSALEKLVRDNITTRGEYQLTDALQLMVAGGIGFQTQVVQDWFDCGKRETWLATNRVLLDRSDQRDSPLGVTPPCSISPDAELRNTKLGPYVSIGSGTRLVDCKLSNCVIGTNAQLSQCRLSGSLVGDCCTVLGVQGEVNVGDFSEIQLIDP